MRTKAGVQHPVKVSQIFALAAVRAAVFVGHALQSILARKL
jgi:hypothetical protein